MEKIIFNCRSITPMFISGVEDNDKEVRASSLKGLLRFWWRAINYKLPLEELRKQESIIFGGTDENSGRSKIIIIVDTKTNPTEKKISMTPHKNRGIQSAYIYNFDVIVKCEKDNEKLIINLFKLLSLVGGIGKRSRRGFGSFEIYSINGVENTESSSLKNTYEIIENLVKGSYKINNNCIEISEKNIKNDYPYIEKIEIAKSKIGIVESTDKNYKNIEDLLERIGQSSHDYDSYYTGYAIDGRFSSPEYTSIIKEKDGYRVINTSLNMNYNIQAIQSMGIQNKKNDTREDYKKGILK